MVPRKRTYIHETKILKLYRLSQDIPFKVVNDRIADVRKEFPQLCLAIESGRPNDFYYETIVKVKVKCGPNYDTLSKADREYVVDQITERLKGCNWWVPPELNGTGPIGGRSVKKSQDISAYTV